MYITMSKRFEFAASHRYTVDNKSSEQIAMLFGKGADSPYGHGHNYVAHLIFHGPIDQDHGMIINVATVKERIQKLLAERYDHKFLNEDTPPFNDILPTPENIAKTLLSDATELFDDEAASPVACRVMEDPDSGAVAYDDGRVERELWLGFSAARRTCSPHLSDKENSSLFGIAGSKAGHGHHYRLRIVLSGEADERTGMIVPDGECARILADLHAEFDHRFLNSDIAEFRSLPVTTEMLAGVLWRRLKKNLPLSRLCLFENDEFFVECSSRDNMYMGLRGSFHAAHRLWNDRMSDEENARIYGKCGSSAGHGHRYETELTITDGLDQRSGTLFPLDRLYRIRDEAVALWDHKHLDKETDDFSDLLSTGEHIVGRLWSHYEDKLNKRLSRVRLWETPNNRFTLRRNRP